jgi:hypothetical protein
VEDHGGQQETDAFGSAIDSSRQATGLARQVEALVEPQQMFIDLASNGSDGFLGDTGEDCVAHFLEYSRADTGRTVYTT